MTRKLSLVSLLVFLSLMTSPAIAFPVPVIPVFSPTVAQASVCNYSWTYAIQCEIQATGFTQYGIPLSAWGQAVIPPGQCGYAYVYSILPNYFIGSTGSADCY